MKHILIAIILLTLAVPSEAQWKNLGFSDQVLAFGIHDTTLFVGEIPYTPLQSILFRYDSTAPALWRGSDTGISRSQGYITSFASLGKYFFAGQNSGPTNLSTNNGSRWTSAKVASPIYSNGRYLFAQYVAPNQFIFSRDSGKDWIADTSLAVASYASIGSCIFANTGNAIWRSRDTGNNWTKLSATLVGTMIPMDSLLFIVGNGSVIESTDSGTNWSAVTVDSAGVPMSVNCLATDGKNLFAGTPSGVLFSTDDGNRWKAVDNNGIPPGYYDVLMMCVYDSALFIDVTGSGSYVLYSRPIPQITDTPQANVVQIPLSDTLSIYPNPATGTVTIQNGTSIFSVSVTNILGTEIFSVPKLNATSITLDLSKEPAGTYFISVQTPNGNSVHKIVKEK